MRAKQAVSRYENGFNPFHRAEEGLPGRARNDKLIAV
jgi:hypothetical protein